MSLYNAKSIPQLAKGAIPRGFEIRPVEYEDFHRGIIDCLKVLTDVGEVTEQKWKELFEYWKKNNDTYFVTVIARAKVPNPKIAAIGTVFIERKLIHGCSKVGHIEDIAVNKKFQGGPGKMGLRLINGLTHIGFGQGCYKVILDCSDKNVGFYQKCGYTKDGAEMVIRARL